MNMNRMCVLAVAVCVSSAASLASAAGGPNFIVINIDDLGYADTSAFGGSTPTPELDRMAREGRKLMSHYAAPVCSPSRAALMTGCYPKRVLPIGGVLFPGAAVGLNPEEVTVAEVLKDAGYATACIGKWHLGDQPEFLPTRQGFDSYYGLPYSNDMGPASDGSKSNLGQPLPKQKDDDTKIEQDDDGIRGNHQPPLPLVENEKVIERVDAKGQQTITRRYTERAVKFIESNKDRSFFLYLPHSAVHFPHYPAPQFVDKSHRDLYHDWVLEIDWSVGQVLDAVRKAGLEKNTLVLFTSDNGGPLKNKSDNGPLRGGKATTFEGGVRVCTIAWWPGKVPAGSETWAMTSMMDVLPTFAALAGAKLPKAKLDGLDVTEVLLGDAKAKGPRDVFYVYRGFDLEAVRQGPWKLHLKTGELYNLDDDLGEASDVAKAHAEVVKRLTKVAEKMDDDLGIKKQLGPGVRPLGRVKNPKPLIAAD
jgi:arylsulfatase A-like enzyme